MITSPFFPVNNFCKGAVDMKFSPDVDNNPSYPYIQISSDMKSCVIKWNDREKALNYWNVFNTSYKSVCWWWQLQDASWRRNYRMHCSGVILSSNLEGYVSLFYELWPLVLIFCWIRVRWLSGRSSSFILFLWNQSRVCLAVFGIIFIILVL